ncbi:hypothetical protein H257_05279 [Aphanomyces astaci]|uniref:Tc1-like transposase DDE domain-containing protein n=1 Tax=Aphanomyces astaci TaxID=112090 RepID=W4GPN1_APHAT|nr:hypothetical protein H257_05279 [Aphanomyces astaci]ETV81652.1 hypothetical protein H257_05279 [Aphanomyces astaci]|eukprot:XP_009828389.1 hypothetical protein H257_05279 [Aphanomyces astaci]
MDDPRNQAACVALPPSKGPNLQVQCAVSPEEGLVTYRLERGSIKMEKNAEFVEEHDGMLLLRLGPYSPMLNPIESCFSVLKARIKSYLALHTDARSAMSDHEVQPPAEMVLDTATPKAKAGKRKEKKASSENKRSVRWCDESVATLFRLRYDSPLAKRFESKNNAEKKTAYVMLAAELSVAMESDYTVAQVQDKKGYQRESLMSTDATIADGTNSSDEAQVKREHSSDDDYDSDKPPERRKKPAKVTKASSEGEALEACFLAIKEGLIHLGTSLSAATPSPPPPPASRATLDDVLRAIQGQSDTMAQLLAHLVARKQIM